MSETVKMRGYETLFQRHSSNPILRATIIQAAHRLIRTHQRYKAMAQSMRERGKPMCVIAAAVGNRWVRRMYFDMNKGFTNRESPMN